MVVQPQATVSKTVVRSLAAVRVDVIERLDFLIVVERPRHVSKFADGARDFRFGHGLNQVHRSIRRGSEPIVDSSVGSRFHSTHFGVCGADYPIDLALHVEQDGKAGGDQYGRENNPHGRRMAG